MPGICWRKLQYAHVSDKVAQHLGFGQEGDVRSMSYAGAAAYALMQIVNRHAHLRSNLNMSAAVLVLKASGRLT